MSTENLSADINEANEIIQADLPELTINGGEVTFDSGADMPLASMPEYRASMDASTDSPEAIRSQILDHMSSSASMTGHYGIRGHVEFRDSIVEMAERLSNIIPQVEIMSVEEIETTRNVPFTKDMFIRLFLRLLQLGYCRTDNIAKYKNHKLREQRDKTIEDVMNDFFAESFYYEGEKFKVADEILYKIRTASVLAQEDENGNVVYPLKGKSTIKINNTLSKSIDRTNDVFAT